MSEVKTKSLTVDQAVAHAREQVKRGEVLSEEQVQRELGITDEEIAFAQALGTVRDELAVLLDGAGEGDRPIPVSPSAIRRLLTVIDNALQ
jgi:hypothetical protein